MPLLRLLLMSLPTLGEGGAPKRNEAQCDRLLTIKVGEFQWTEVHVWGNDMHRNIAQAVADNRLPERPDYQAGNRVLIDAHSELALSKQK